MARRPTILDVAREAGVSKSTVSLVLQGAPVVRDSTRKKVDRAIEVLGYVRNSSAAALGGAAPSLVGLVINDLRNPFFTEIAASAQMAFAREGYATVVANTDEDPDVQSRVIASMIGHGVEALAVCPAFGGADSFGAALRSGTPAMQFLRRVEERTALVPFAAPDYRDGGAQATRHLIGLGARRIAFAGGLPDRPVTAERMEGYLAEAGRAGLEPLSYFGRPSRALGRELAQEIAAASPPVDAVLCFSDLVALGMMAGFAEIGIVVGEDIRVAGFDDIEEAALAFPPLTSVRCNASDFGERIARTLLAWIGGEGRPPDEERTAVMLVPRRSTLGRRSDIVLRAD